MNALKSFFNSPFGLLLSGAVISGLLVPLITFKWQDEQWRNQQIFTARQSLFQKELDTRYQLIEEANEALADILTHSQIVVVCYQKRVSGNQLVKEINNYNDSVSRWEKRFNVIRINIEAFFSNPKIVKEWDDIKELRDLLDINIYLISKNKKKIKIALGEIRELTNKQVMMSKAMVAETKKSKLHGVRMKK